MLTRPTTWLKIGAIGLIGLALLLIAVPLILHVGWGADNDAYIAIIEYGGKEPTPLAIWPLAPIFRPAYFLWPALSLGLGLFLLGLYKARSRA